MANSTNGANGTNPRKVAEHLPIELVSLIMTATDDYELATTIGIPHSIPETTPWLEQATPLDRAILTGRIYCCKERISRGDKKFTSWGARVMIRFSYIHLLDCFERELPKELRKICSGLLPAVASAWGRVEVLQWGLKRSVGMDHIEKDAMDDASRHGHVDVLEWWKSSGLPLVYSEDALSSATIKRQIDALEWWKHSGLPLKIGNVLDFASMEGTTDVLNWWAKSGLECKYSKMALYHLSCKGNIALLEWWRTSDFSLLYDKDVLVGATKHGQTAALDWWLTSGLKIPYRFFDIEEALEDAVTGTDETQAWWRKRGFSESADLTESAKVRLLTC